MDALYLLFACLALGLVTARFFHPPQGLVPGLNWWILNIALPALVLELIPRLHFDPQFWFLAAAMWIVFLGGWAVAAAAGAYFGWSRERIGALALTAGLGNTAFTGYPLIEALRGKEALGLAVVADQVGCFMALAIGGILVASIYSGGKTDAKTVIRRIVVFPPFVSLLTGVVVGALGGWPPEINAILTRVGATLTPLALFSIGLQFSLRLERAQFGAVGVGLAWKLALAPLIIYTLGVLTGIEGEILAVGVLQAAMAPMISGAILAAQHGLDARVANATLGIGVLICLATVPLLNQFL